PNGAPFTMYPYLIRLLMDRDYRLQCLEQLNREAVSMSLMKDLDKEFTLYDIAVMTRTAAARLLGLPDRGHLRSGAVADIAVYREQADKAAMFADAELLFKNGRLA